MKAFDKPSKLTFKKRRAAAWIVPVPSIWLERYESYVAAHPTDAKSAEYLFKAGEIYSLMRQPTQAISTYQRLYKEFPQHERAPHALFMTGFSYENTLRQLDSAKVVYNQFLKTYPQHEFAKSAQFSLDNLGKSPDEIVKELEQKAAKGDTTARK